MGGDRLHVEHQGEAGPAIVLAHGFGGSARNWRPQARAFKDRFRVTSYDAVGHARSTAPEAADAYRLGAAVATLAHVVGETGDAHPIVGGLSMGAAVALEWALGNPAIPAALVLASFPAGPDSGNGISAQAGPFADAIERDGLDAAGEQFAWGPTSGLDERGRALVRQGFSEHAPYALAHTLRELLARLPSPERFRDRLTDFPAPVLILAGDRDEASVEAGRILSSASDRISFEIIADAGHVVNLAQPAAYNACVLEWLALHRVAWSDSSASRSS